MTQTTKESIKLDYEALKKNPGIIDRYSDEKILEMLGEHATNLSRNSEYFEKIKRRLLRLIEGRINEFESPPTAPEIGKIFGMKPQIIGFLLNMEEVWCLWIDKADGEKIRGLKQGKIEMMRKKAKEHFDARISALNKELKISEDTGKEDRAGAAGEDEGKINELKGRIKVLEAVVEMQNKDILRLNQLLAESRKANEIQITEIHNLKRKIGQLANGTDKNGGTKSPLSKNNGQKSKRINWEKVNPDKITVEELSRALERKTEPDLGVIKDIFVLSQSGYKDGMYFSESNGNEQEKLEGLGLGVKIQPLEELKNTVREGVEQVKLLISIRKGLERLILEISKKIKKGDVVIVTYPPDYVLTEKGRTVLCRAGFQIEWGAVILTDGKDIRHESKLLKLTRTADEEEPRRTQMGQVSRHAWGDLLKEIEDSKLKLTIADEFKFARIFEKNGYLPKYAPCKIEELSKLIPVIIMVDCSEIRLEDNTQPEKVGEFGGNAEYRFGMNRLTAFFGQEKPNTVFIHGEGTNNAVLNKVLEEYTGRINKKTGMDIKFKKPAKPDGEKPRARFRQTV
ncbi:hypothetical protein JXB01_01790 [Candidatus Micrarchaeota archaeon]|nr:hypothetical protein [Candidatus Micrarchaeota archaeon]